MCIRDRAKGTRCWNLAMVWRRCLFLYLRRQNIHGKGRAQSLDQHCNWPRRHDRSRCNTFHRKDDDEGTKAISARCLLNHYCGNGTRFTGIPCSLAISIIRFVQTESFPGNASMWVACSSISLAKVATASGLPLSCSELGLGLCQASVYTARGIFWLSAQRSAR